MAEKHIVIAPDEDWWGEMPAVEYNVKRYLYDPNIGKVKAEKQVGNTKPDFGMAVPKKIKDYENARVNKDQPPFIRGFKFRGTGRGILREHEEAMSDYAINIGKRGILYRRYRAGAGSSDREGAVHAFVEDHGIDTDWSAKASILPHECPHCFPVGVAVQGCGHPSELWVHWRVGSPFRHGVVFTLNKRQPYQSNFYYEESLAVMLGWELEDYYYHSSHGRMYYGYVDEIRKAVQKRRKQKRG